jgi:hypothetical protein
MKLGNAAITVTIATMADLQAFQLNLRLGEAVMPLRTGQST